MRQDKINSKNMSIPMTGYALFFATLKRRAWRKSIGLSVFF